jgi:hypothetical protein
MQGPSLEGTKVAIAPPPKLIFKESIIREWKIHITIFLMLIIL